MKVLSITSLEVLRALGLQKATLLFQRHTLLIYWKIVPEMTNASFMYGMLFQFYRIVSESLDSYVNLMTDFVRLSPGAPFAISRDREEYFRHVRQG